MNIVDAKIRQILLPFPLYCTKFSKILSQYLHKKFQGQVPFSMEVASMSEITIKIASNTIFAIDHSQLNLNISDEFFPLRIKFGSFLTEIFNEEMIVFFVVRVEES